MGKLSDWILHRAAFLGVSFPDGVSDISGVEPATLARVIEKNSLRAAGRSARGYLARALQVSVRDLEALDSGKTQWIADEQQVRLDGQCSFTIAPPGIDVPAPVSCSIERGIPIFGRVLPTGLVDHFENWSTDDGPRLPVRYAGNPDAFALRLETDIAPHLAGDFLVFQPVAPGVLQDGDLAIVTCGEGRIDTELCKIEKDDPMMLRLLRITADSEGMRGVAIMDILRAARVIGVWNSRIL